MKRWWIFIITGIVFTFILTIVIIQLLKQKRGQKYTPIDIKPLIAYGTYDRTSIKGGELISSALNCGYRCIDTALDYHNEHLIGKIISKRHERSKIFLVSKIPERKYFELETTLKLSLRKLQTSYIDAYLLHSIPKDRNVLLNTWERLIGLYRGKLVKYIGISKATLDDILFLEKKSGFLPHIVQNCYRVEVDNDPLEKFCLSRGILLMFFGICHPNNIQQIDNQVQPGDYLIKRLSEKGIMPIIGSSSIKRIEHDLEIVTKNKQ